MNAPLSATISSLTNNSKSAYTRTEVKNIIAYKDAEIAIRLQLNASKDAEILRLQNVDLVKDVEILRLHALNDAQQTLQPEGSLLQAQSDLHAVNTRAAVTLNFKAAFPTIRLIDERKVDIVVFETETLERAMIDFSSRIGETFEDLEFRYKAQVVRRYDRVDQLKLVSGDKIEVFSVQ